MDLFKTTFEFQMNNLNNYLNNYLKICINVIKCNKNTLNYSKCFYNTPNILINYRSYFGKFNELNEFKRILEYFYLLEYRIYLHEITIKYC